MYTQEGEEFLAREAKRTKTDEDAAQEEKEPEVAAEAWSREAGNYDRSNFCSSSLLTLYPVIPVPHTTFIIWHCAHIRQ